MSKIIEITKCSDCPHYNEWFDNGKCFMLDKKTDLDTIPDDCPLEDSKVFAHSVMMRPVHEFNGIMVDDINITPPIFEDLDYEVDKEMRREFGKDTVTIKEWHEKCDKNRRYHEDMLDKVFSKEE